MNLTGIATRSIMSALQRSLRAQQRDMMESQQEVQTGQKADASRFLGELASKRISLVRDAERLVWAAEVRETGRAAQGVKVIDLDEGDAVVAVAKLASLGERDEAPEEPEDADAAGGAAPSGDEPESE